MNFTTSVRRISFPPERRLIAISDIHGHKTWLQELLRQVGFCGEDLLVLGGDYIERGAENLACLRYVMELCRRPNVYAIPGNVDAGTARVIEEPQLQSPEEIYEFIRGRNEYFGTCFFQELADEAGLPLDSPRHTAEALGVFRREFAPELDFLHSLPVILEDDRFVFVHGGLPECPIASLEGGNAMGLMKNDAFWEQGLSFRELGKFVVVGHWPVDNYSGDFSDCTPFIDRERNIISIDGGCGVKRTGQLNAMIAEGEKITFASYDDLPEVTAESDQEESESSVYLKWVDSRVELLQPGERFCRVRRVSDGRVFQAPADFLYLEAGETHCRAFTDYRLPVRAGDTLKLIEEGETGFLVKKNGRTGWYFGSLKR